MRAITVLLSFPFLVYAGFALAAQPYDGVWGDLNESCRTEDSRLVVQGNRFEWYETQCQARTLSRTGRVWRLAMNCRGEGRKWRSVAGLTLSSPDRLIMENAPVGPTKRQVYKRCSASKR